MCGDTFRLRREMGCTRAALVADITRVTGTAPTRTDDHALRIVTAEGTIDVTLQQKASRQIGAFAIPVLDVELCFRGFEPAARDAFLARFDLYTRRGGG